MHIIEIEAPQVEEKDRKASALSMGAKRNSFTISVDRFVRLVRRVHIAHCTLHKLRAVAYFFFFSSCLVMHSPVYWLYIYNIIHSDSNYNVDARRIECPSTSRVCTLCFVFCFVKLNNIFLLHRPSRP